MFERFTQSAISVIMFAQEETRRLGHKFLGTETLLLGLLSEKRGMAGDVLECFGINLKDTRVEVEKIIGRGSGFVPVEIPFTERAKNTLTASWDIARNLKDNHINTEHLLLGLIKESKRSGGGVAARVFEKGSNSRC